MDSDKHKNGQGLTGEEIVVSGISGHFPNTENIKKLIDNLYNKVDMVRKIEYGIKHPELPQYFGQIDGLDRFDAHFFRVTKTQAVSFDPVGRKIMEQAYSAIFDAGINPETLKSTKLGVFIGSSLSDTSTLALHEIFNCNGFVITGCSKTMLANRISYWIDGKGSSYGLDAACASSMACLEIAIDKLRAGDCDSALVGASVHSMNPVLTLNMKRAGLLCLDGKTKCFDKNGDGYVRSDAIAIIFLQKAKDAKRIYSEVYHVKGKQFSKVDPITTQPMCEANDIENFLQDFYAHIDVSPSSVEFVEANATGLAKADGNELEAIGKVFGNEKPVKVGSIKSNMGHTQCVSGVCSLIKLCLALQKGVLPANLHFGTPLDHINAVNQRKVQVVTENTPFYRSFVALNNFSMTGSNYHVLLKGHYKPKKNNLYKCQIPRLVLVSGRQETCVNTILDILENNPVDCEQIALLNNVFKYNIPGHTGRGYILLETNEKNQTLNLARSFEYFPGHVRPVWFLYSGMGSQWPSMGADLMRIPIFAAAIKRVDKVLRNKGLDIVNIITNKDNTIFEDILNSFVGIAAVQIGLTDVLKSMGISPDYIIGHSVGEIGCAYADGCLTTEEVILASYLRGIVSKETKFIKGKMAAVGLAHQKVRDLCPPEIDIACQNSSESTTISGPVEAVEQFVEYLTGRSIFAKTVASANIAYHSRYIADAGPKLLSAMKDILKNPRLRSKKWLSTCFCRDHWNDDVAKYASSEYFTYNLLNTVHFDETAQLIPADAIVIEIAPHGLLQAILKRSHSNCLNIPLTRRGDNDNALHLLKAIGTLYQAGLNPDIDVLYPEVDFPVSTETPGLSHFVEWDHSEQWQNNSHEQLYKKNNAFSYEFNMSIHDDDYSHIKGYMRNGINVLPESTVLVLVWETFAMCHDKKMKDLSVVFHNIIFHDVLKIKSEKILSLLIQIERGSHTFEVTHNELLVASGSIKLLNKNKNKYETCFHDSDIHLNIEDIYKLMSTKGYSYKGKFQSMQCTNMKMNKALLQWEENWINFLDSLFQINALSKNHDGVSSVKFIDKLVINLAEHRDTKTVIKNDTVCYSARLFEDIGVTQCGGVTMRSVVFSNTPKLEQTADQLHVRYLSTHNYHTVDVRTLPQHMKLIITDAHKFSWVEISPSPSKQTVQVFYASVSMDSKNVSKYGSDFSGLNARGDRVMGLVSETSVSSLVESEPELLWPVPQHWDLEEAATVPLPYLYALYCLFIRSNVRRRNTIFISNGDGELGQAVISICLNLDCTVFTTVSNMDKKMFLMRLFPKLDETKIGYSYEVFFKYMVMNATKGNRCDIVIDGSKGKLREAAMDCVGFYSTFLDVSDHDKEENKSFGMNFNKESREYKSVCFSNIFLEENMEERKLLRVLLCNGVNNGSVKPLTRVVYSTNEISRACQLLSKENHIGRVLINMKHQKHTTCGLNILPRLSLAAHHQYIVVCDRSELGVELIEHLIKRGARRFLIHMKPKLMNGYFHVKYSSWKKYDVTVNFNADDIQTIAGCENLVKQGNILGSIDGIFITVNETAQDQTENEIFNYGLITSNLDLLSRSLDSLSFFAYITQTSRHIRNEQTFLDIEKCCYARNEVGLPSLVLRSEANIMVNTPMIFSKLFSALESSLKLNYTSVLIGEFGSSTNRTEIENPKRNGFDVFLINLSKDELIATEPMISMKTQLNNENESEIHLNPEEEHLMIVPGFDNNYVTMAAISERLKIPAMTLQFEPDFCNSIPEIATRLLNVIKMRFHTKPKFYLLGYSFGVNIALELAALLEKEGKVGVVYCLDSSPDAIKIQLDTYLGAIADQELQNSLIQHIYKLLTGEQSSELNDKLKGVKELPEKIDNFIAISKRKITNTHEFLRTLINTTYQRFVLAKEYKPNYKLESEIVLMKGNPHPKAEKLQEDYGLAKLSRKPIKVYNILADHHSAPQDCRVSNIIHRILEPRLLEEFNKKNLCQYYYE